MNAAETSSAQAAESPWTTRLNSVWGARLLAVLAGVASSLGFQPFNLWPLLPFGIGALTFVAHRAPRTRTALGLGYLYGLSFLAVSVGWTYVIAVPVAVLLVAFEALWFGLQAYLVRLARSVPGWPVLAAGTWVVVEYLYGHYPFGGFGWTRLGFAAVDSPFAGFYPFLATSGVSFLVALTGQLLAALALRGLRRDDRLKVGAIAIATALVAGTGLALGSWNPDQRDAGVVTVGMVQGNVDGVGIEFLGRARSVTNNHLSETVTLMAKARTGEIATPDFVLWPENSTDIDPLKDAETNAVVQAAAEIAGVPILVGALMSGPGPNERQTTSLWWDPNAGVLARYSKRNLVPFGEWIPYRDLLLPLVPMLQLVGAQGVPGTGPGILDVPIPNHGKVRVGMLICFELAYDDTVREMLTGTDGRGAQLVTVQSNNATYAGTGQVAQQYAITRVRAMESRREILVATTNSLSGFISRDGVIEYTTQERTSASISEQMPLRTQLTPAVRYGAGLERTLIIVTLVGLAAAAWRSRRGVGRPAARPKG